MMGFVLLNPSYSWPYGTAKNVRSDFNLLENSAADLLQVQNRGYKRYSSRLQLMRCRDAATRLDGHDGNSPGR
jgi:hypothetical protein